MSDNTKKLQEKLAEAKKGGGDARIKKQHDKKKLTARERVAYLLDEGSFEEMGILVTHRTTDFGMDKQKYYGDGGWWATWRSEVLTREGAGRTRRD